MDVARSRRRRLLWGAATAAVVAYSAYRASQTETVQRKRRELQERLEHLSNAVSGYSEAFLAGGQVFSLLLKDLLSFLTSESTEVPQSIRQLSRLLRSKDAVETVRAHVRAALSPSSDGTDGGAAKSDNGAAPPAAAAQLLEALLSDRGQSLVSLVVARAARESVLAAMEVVTAAGEPAPPALEFLTDRTLGFLTTQSGREVMVQAVSSLVATAVSTYLDKTSAEPVLERIVSQTLTGDATRRALEQVMGHVGKEVAVTLLSPGKSPRPGSPGAPQRAARRWTERDIEEAYAAGFSTPGQAVHPGNQGGSGAARHRPAANFAHTSGAAAAHPRRPLGSSPDFQALGGGGEAVAASEACPAPGGSRAASPMVDEPLSRLATVPERYPGPHRSLGGGAGASGPGGSPLRHSAGALGTGTANAAPAAAAPLPPPPMSASASQSDLKSASCTALAPVARPQQQQQQLVAAAPRPASAGGSDASESAGLPTWQLGLVREVMKVAVQPEGRQLMREVAGTITSEAVKTVLSYMNPFSRLHRGSRAAAESRLEVGPTGFKAVLRSAATGPASVPDPESGEGSFSTSGARLFARERSAGQEPSASAPAGDASDAVAPSSCSPMNGTGRGASAGYPALRASARNPTSDDSESDGQSVASSSVATGSGRGARGTRRSYAGAALGSATWLASQLLRMTTSVPLDAIGSFEGP